VSGSNVTGERRLVAAAKDVAWLVLLVLMVPLAILVVGTPVVLFVRLLIEIAARL
jgi:hypothetical protein